jgi:hypothetical protein
LQIKDTSSIPNTQFNVLCSNFGDTNTYNGVIKQYDTGILYTNNGGITTTNNGLFIGPNLGTSALSGGMRLDNSGNVSFSNSVSINSQNNTALASLLQIQNTSSNPNTQFNVICSNSSYANTYNGIIKQYDTGILYTNNGGTTTTNNGLFIGPNLGTSVLSGGMRFDNSGNVSFYNSVSINSQYIRSSYRIITTTETIASPPYYDIYPLAPTAGITLTLPTASFNLLGVCITFRRVGGTATVVITSSSNIYPTTSFTSTTTLLASNARTVTICCTYLTETTYGWFVI